MHTLVKLWIDLARPVLNKIPGVYDYTHPYLSYEAMLIEQYRRKKGKQIIQKQKQKIAQCKENARDGD